MIFDYESGALIHGLSDRMGMDSDGDLMMRLSDHMAMDMDSGELHMTSRWPSEEEEDR